MSVQNIRTVECIKILNELYFKRKNAEVALAISGYYSSFGDSAQAIIILDEFIKEDSNNIKVLNQLASLLLFEDNKEKAIEYKLRVYKYYKFNKNRKKQKADSRLDALWQDLVCWCQHFRQ